MLVFMNIGRNFTNLWEVFQMMIKLKKIIVMVLGTAILFIMATSMRTFASSGSGTITVSSGSVYKTAVSGASRTGNYSYVHVRATSVYPTGTYTEDNYTKCKTRLYKNDSTSTAISDSYTLTEGALYTKVTIKEGYLSLTKFNLCFAGNNASYGAVINYTYAGN